MIILAPEILDPEDIPLCPLCDQPILDWQEGEVAVAGGLKCLAHEDCIEELEEHPND